MLKKSEVIREGYKKGLKTALEIINREILSESNGESDFDQNLRNSLNSIEWSAKYIWNHREDCPHDVWTWDMPYIHIEFGNGKLEDGLTFDKISYDSLEKTLKITSGFKGKELIVKKVSAENCSKISVEEMDFENVIVEGDTQDGEGMAPREAAKVSIRWTPDVEY